MTKGRPQDPRTKRIADQEAETPTIGPPEGPSAYDKAGETVVPDDLDAEGLEAPKPKGATRGGAALDAAKKGERTMTADNLAEVRKEVRAKAEAQAAPKKKGASWVVWVLAFLVLGGIGFGVAWLVMNPPGGESVAAAEPDASEAAHDAAESAADAAAADAAGDAATKTDAAAEASGEVAVAAAPDAAAAADATAGEVQAAVADAAGEGLASADAGAAAVADGAVETAVATADAAAETTAGDTVAAVAAADAVAVAVADAAAIAPTVDVSAAVPPADAAAPADAAPAKPFVPNPIEATRLNEDGLSRRKAGDHAGALHLYEQALAADPNHVWARYNYACELALAGRGKDALAELTKLYKSGTADAKRALQAARKDSDFRSIKDTGQFFRLTNF